MQINNTIDLCKEHPCTQAFSNYVFTVDTHTHTQSPGGSLCVHLSPVCPVLFWERNGISFHLLLFRAALDEVDYCAPTAGTATHVIVLGGMKKVVV